MKCPSARADVESGGRGLRLRELGRAAVGQLASLRVDFLTSVVEQATPEGKGGKAVLQI
jgi:hypothetical protein